MHHGHWVICGMPSAISSLVLPGIAPSLNASLSKSKNARYASGTSSRIRLNCVGTSTPWNSIVISPLPTYPAARAPALPAPSMSTSLVIPVGGVGGSGVAPPDLKSMHGARALGRRAPDADASGHAHALDVGGAARMHCDDSVALLELEEAFG